MHTLADRERAVLFLCGDFPSIPYEWGFAPAISQPMENAECLTSSHWETYIREGASGGGGGRT